MRFNFRFLLLLNAKGSKHVSYETEKKKQLSCVIQYKHTIR